MIDYGHGVRLSDIYPEILDKLKNWRNTPEIYKWCRQDNLISEYQQSRWYESIQNNPKVKMYVIIDLNNNLVGVCGLTDIEHINRHAEFSLYIGLEHQRKGYATKALKTLMDLAFNWYNLNMVWGETFEGNPALKIFTDLGFKQDGLRRQFYYKNGKYLDCHLVSILRSEWCPG